MAWAATAVGVGSLIAGTATSLIGSHNARKDQKELNREYLKRLDISADELDVLSSQYVSAIENLEVNFDPYEMEQAFNSLYEAIIMPMEREFDESVLPSIQEAYTGGLSGDTGLMSGAAREAEGAARRSLLEKESQLKYQERDKTIDRNRGDLLRKEGLEFDKFNALKEPIKARAGLATEAYRTGSETIASRLASSNQLASGISTIGTTGANLYQSGRNSQDRDAQLDKIITNLTKNDKETP